MKSGISTNSFNEPTGPIRRTNKAGPLTLFLALSLFSTIAAFAQKGGDKSGGRINKADKKDTETWNAEEYSGLRGGKELQAALTSKGFAWISGSPAANEKLPIGKNVQFFGFVALRCQSGRSQSRNIGPCCFCNRQRRATPENGLPRCWTNFSSTRESSHRKRKWNSRDS